MSDKIITVSDIGKRFLISHEAQKGYTALRDVISKKAKKIFSFPQRLQNNSAQATKEEFWALKDVSFEINEGDKVGIVGRNGAGKSTLLKILSRITEPTKGEIRITGRVASLLEVGTGFHPELSGRENIFLNGAILGMSRREIRKKFDEIVDFAEVEKFLDTPVKRYSSGMYVRLAFAVAAHLEPEILIVDEVLAVGDAEFQKKCLGKMQDISDKQGPTILFVSHNFTAVRSLCTSAILLNKGVVESIGETESVLKEYIKHATRTHRVNIAESFKGRNCNEFVCINDIELISDTEIGGTFEINKAFKIRVRLDNKNIDSKLNVNLFVYSQDNTLIFPACSPQKEIEKGLFEVECEFPPHFFNDNFYSISLMVVARETPLLTLEEVIQIEGIEPPRDSAWLGKFPGLLRPTFNWKI